MSGKIWPISAVCLALLLALSGCIPALPLGYIVEQKPPIALTNDPPANECERKEWLALVPARARASGQVAYNATPYHYTSVVITQNARLERSGLAVQETAFENLLTMPEVEAELGEYEVVEEHLDAMESTENQRAWAESVATSGAVVMGVSVVAILGALFYNIGGDDYLQGPQMYVLLGSTGVTLLGSLMFAGGYLMRPGPAEQAEYGVRNRIFSKPQDNLEALSRAVADHNAEVRRRCANNSERQVVYSAVHDQ